MGEACLRAVGFSVRVANEGDMPGVLVIEQEAISPAWTHGALLAEVYSDSSFFAVACGGGAVLGFAILRRAGDEGELLQIAVDRSARRRGVADFLMGAALKFAVESALEAVYLEVRKGNAAAVALYEKHGFVPVRRRVGYYSDPVEDAVVMCRRVRSAERKCRM